MSFAQDGLISKVKTHEVVMKVKADHQLIRLANAIPWGRLAEIVLPDLKGTTAKGCWMLGRKLYLRVHLGIYILQARFNRTDRGIVEEVQNNAIYRAFCGSSVISQWKCPHATKVEEFRSRLSPETKMRINEEIVKVAVDLGYADPACMDIDSTVQEANISYPTDARLILKLAEKCEKIRDALRLAIPFDLKDIRRKARSYFFRGKQCSPEEKTALLTSYYKAVREMVLPIVAIAEARVVTGIGNLKWTTQTYLKQVGIYGRQYLRDVGYFIRTHRAKPAKMLAFHAREVACITKGKAAREYEFGRVFQIARIGGNFLLSLCTGKLMPDKKAVAPMIVKHQEIFGTGTLKSLGGDKGYYSRKNIKAARQAAVTEIGLQEPGNLKRSVNPTDPEQKEKVRCRRAGIEPLIGHVKKMGLGKSVMKNDRNTHGSGFKALMGFNLCQMERKLQQEALNMAN